MYKVFVPIFNKPMTLEQKEKITEQLNRFNPDLIFLSYQEYIWDYVCYLHPSKTLNLLVVHFL